MSICIESNIRDEIFNLDTYLSDCSSENFRRRDTGIDRGDAARDGHVSLHSQQQRATDGQQALFRQCSL